MLFLHKNMLNKSSAIPDVNYNFISTTLISRISSQVEFVYLDLFESITSLYWSRVIIEAI